MIAGQVGAGILLTAIEAAVIVPAEQRAVAQRWAEAPDDPALYRNNGLQVYAGALAGKPLDPAEIRRQSCSDAVDDIAFGVGRNCLVDGDPASRLPRHIQSQDSMHEPKFTDVVGALKLL